MDRTTHKGIDMSPTRKPFLALSLVALAAAAAASPAAAAEQPAGHVKVTHGVLRIKGTGASQRIAAPRSCFHRFSTATGTMPRSSRLSSSYTAISDL